MAPRGEHPPIVVGTSYRAFRQFNAPDLRTIGGSRQRLGPTWEKHFPGESMTAQLVHSLARHQALPVKELLESFEMFERTRKPLRGPVVADLCCGHGLTGLLFAALERRVERVVLVDKHPPNNRQRVLDAICAVAPWVAQKVDWQARSIRSAVGDLPPRAGVLGLHACGSRSDQCVDAAISLDAPVAVVPCCYSGTGRDAPDAVREQLGVPTAADVARTYRLEAAGYTVRWRALPEWVTPMNRLIIGLPGD